jgi:DNA-binding transcriptional LysR family regulator
MNIAELDLNLLQTFQALHATGNVSRAAERLGLSQPSVSHALRKLRETYGDPLFVRSGGGMAPTAKADRLAKAVHHALRILDVAIHETEQYEPANSERVFRLHMSDAAETVFLPALMGELAKRAPDVRLDISQLDEKEIRSALETGRLDLAIGSFPGLGAAFDRQFLLRDKYVVLMRAGHPLAKSRQTAAALKRLNYVMVRSHSAIARILHELDLEDRVRLSIPHFMVLAPIIADTDLAAIVPFRPSQVFAQSGKYAVSPLQVALPSFEVAVHWHWRFDGDPGNRWLRESITSLFGE